MCRGKEGERVQKCGVQGDFACVMYYQFSGVKTIYPSVVRFAICCGCTVTGMPGEFHCLKMNCGFCSEQAGGLCGRCNSGG